MKFEYDSMKVTPTMGEYKYEFQGVVHYDLMDALNDAGKHGWEFVMVHMGKYIMKRGYRSLPTEEEMFESMG